MKHENREHNPDAMGRVVMEALRAVMEGAERERICTGCALRSLLSSLMMTIAGNEPDTTDDEIIDMLGEMVSAALLARSHLLCASEDETVH